MGTGYTIVRLHAYAVHLFPGTQPRHKIVHYRPQGIHGGIYDKFGN